MRFPYAGHDDGESLRGEACPPFVGRASVCYLTGMNLRHPQNGKSTVYLSRMILAPLFLSTSVIVLFFGCRAISLRKAETCQPPSASTATALVQELSRFHPESVVKFAVLYRQGKDQIKEDSVDEIWLFQILRRSRWDVDWFQTDVDLKVHGFCIVVNDSSVLPPSGVELARVLAQHSIPIRWVEEPRIVSWTTDWCVYVGC